MERGLIRAIRSELRCNGFDFTHTAGSSVWFVHKVGVTHAGYYIMQSSLIDHLKQGDLGAYINEFWMGMHV